MRMSDDEAQREALDGILKADGWVVITYTTDGAGEDGITFITNAYREVPYMIERGLHAWQHSIAETDAGILGDEALGDDDDDDDE